MTVAAFYAKYAIDGRATLRGRGRPALYVNPDVNAWIVKISAFGRTTYWLCKRDDFEIQLLDPLAETNTINRENTPHSKAWHREMQRSAHHELAQIA